MAHQHDHCEHCGHHHGHEHKHEHEHHHDLKGQVVRIVITVILLIGAVLIEKNCQLPTWQLLLV